MFEYSQQPLPTIQRVPQNQPSQGMSQQSPASQIPNPQMMQAFQQFQSQVQAIMRSSDPKSMLNALAQQNPMIKQTMDTVSQMHQGNGKEAFYSAGRARGLSDSQIDQIVAGLRQSVNV